MTEWQGRLRSLNMATKEAETAFKLSLQQSLLDPIIAQQYREIFKPMLTPIMDALNQSNALVDTLRTQLEAKNQEVAELRSEVDGLKVMYDDLEQHGRRGSMRVFGVPNPNLIGYLVKAPLKLIYEWVNAPHCLTWI